MKSRKKLIAGTVLSLFALTQCTTKRHLQASKTSSTPPILVFQNGFEGTSAVKRLIKAPSNVTEHYETDHIEGADIRLSDKSNWSIDMDQNPDAGTFLIEYTGGDTSKRTARIISEPGNPQSKVLAFDLKEACEASENQTKARIQADIYHIKKGYKEFYQSVRVFIPSDAGVLGDSPNAITWLNISEFWNNEWWIAGEKYGFRVTLGIGKPVGKSGLYFILNAENSGQKEVWNANKFDAKVPIGKWFTIDYYFKEGDKSNGRFYMSITPNGESKKVVFDVTNWTYNQSDPAPDGVTGYNPMKLYTSKAVVDFMRAQGKTIKIYWDDFKL